MGSGYSFSSHKFKALICLFWIFPFSQQALPSPSTSSGPLTGLVSWSSSPGRLDLVLFIFFLSLPSSTPFLLLPFLLFLSTAEKVYFLSGPQVYFLSCNWNCFLWTQLCNNIAKFLRYNPQKSLHQFLTNPVSTSSLTFLLLSPLLQSTGLLKIFNSAP